MIGIGIPLTKRVKRIASIKTLNKNHPVLRLSQSKKSIQKFISLLIVCLQKRISVLSWRCKSFLDGTRTYPPE
jgi:hypothetical protein